MPTAATHARVMSFSIINEHNFDNFMKGNVCTAAYLPCVQVGVRGGRTEIGVL